MVTPHILEGCKGTTLETGSVFTALCRLTQGNGICPKGKGSECAAGYLVTF